MILTARPGPGFLPITLLAGLVGPERALTLRTGNARVRRDFLVFVSRPDPDRVPHLDRRRNDRVGVRLAPALGLDPRPLSPTIGNRR
jgi:hypothetical protein